MILRVGIEAWGLAGSARFTGMGQYTANLLEHLPRLGAEVIAYGAPHEPAPEWLPSQVTWRAVGTTRRRSSAITSRLTMLDRCARHDMIDVFHVPGLHLRPSFPPVPRVACPVVVTVHDAIPVTHYGRDLPARNRAFVRWNARRARNSAALVTVSTFARDEIAAAFGVAADRMVVIPNGVDFDPVHDPGVPNRLGLSAPFVLAAGSHEPRKNLTGAIAAFERVAVTHPELHLVAVVDRGSGHAHEVEDHLARSSQGHRVHLLDELADRDLRALYTAATAVMFVSFAEGFGFPAVQALRCGTPLVASRLDVLREITGDLALLVDPHDPEDIARALARVLDDDQLRERVAALGPAQVARFDAQECVRRHLDVYRAVAREPVHA